MQISFRRVKLFTIFLSVMVVLTGCTNGGEQVDEIIKKQVSIQDISVQTELATELTLSGTVVPKEYSVVRSLTNGTIEYIVPVGTQVLRGQSLFNIRDSAIESSFFNAQQNLEKTNVLSQQRVQQAELAVNSSKARLDLARASLGTTNSQTDQSLYAAQKSALVAYSSAYTNLTSVINYLSRGTFDGFNYRFDGILTSFSDLRSQSSTDFNSTVGQYQNLSPTADLDTVAIQLPQMQSALDQAKKTLDNISIVLEGALPGGNFNSSEIASSVLTVGTYQATVNASVSSIITAGNAVENTQIGNRLTISQAQAQVDLAQIDYDNALIALDNARQGAILEQTGAKSQFDQAAYGYNNLSLAAPFSGTIMSHYAKAGEQAGVGREIVEIGNLSLVEITLDIDAELSKALTLGDTVKVDQYQGRISEIEPAGDIQSGKVQVKVESDADGLVKMAGEVVDATVNLRYRELNDIIVPIKSVVIEAGGNYVFVATDGKVERRSVSLGRVFGDKVSVLSGLQAGDQLIILNGIFVAVGDEIEIVQ